MVQLLISGSFILVLATAVPATGKQDPLADKDDQTKSNQTLGKDLYLWLSLSYGQRTNPELLDEIKQLFGPVRPAMSEPTHNRVATSTARTELEGSSEELAVAGNPDQTATSDRQDPLAELGAKIARNLADEKWSEASKSFVAALWQDYRAAHANPPKQASQVAVGKDPDVESYDDYLGAYTQAGIHGAAKPFLEVVKDEAGRFHVKLEDHTIPAVTIGKTVVFTTGDVVHSPLPSLADKPYCTLEMLMIIRTDGRFFFGSPSAPPDRWIPLHQAAKPQ